MAETIGRAYIKILADGSGLPESIRREVSSSEVKKAAEEGGRDFDKAYAKGFEDEERKSKNFSKSLSRTLDKGFKQVNEDAGRAGSRSGALMGDRLALNLENRIRESFPDLEDIAGDLGERMGESMRKDFVQHGNFTKSFESYLQKAIADHKRFEDTINRNHAEALRINLAMDQRAENERMRMLRVHARALRDNAAWDERESKRSHGRLGRFAQDWEKVSDKVGGMFGKGSRNDFVNIFGSLMGAIANIPGMLASVGQKFKDFADQVGKAFTDAGSFGEGIVASLGEVGTKLGPVLVGLVAFAALVAGPVVSALWLLLGAVTSLVSTK